MISLTVIHPSRNHAYITLPDGTNLVTVNRLEHVECVKQALEAYINGTVANGNVKQNRTGE